MANKSSDVPPLPDPNPGENKKETRVDADKFKKVMEVKESEDTQQRNKRNRPRVQEEDEEEATDDTPPSPDLFKSKMQDAPTQEETPTTETSATTDDDTPTDKPTKETPYSMMAKDRQKTYTDQKTTEDKQEPKIIPKNDAFLEMLAEEGIDDEELLKLAQSPTTEHKKKDKKHEQKEIDILSQTPLPQPPTETPTKKKKSDKKIEEKALLQKENIPTPPPEKTKEKKPLLPATDPLEEKKQEQKKDKEEILEQALPAEHTIMPPAATQEPTPPPHIFSLLQPEVYALFEKLVGILMVEKDKHQTVVTVEISNQNSLFHNSRILIQSYPTAPKQFHIQLQGNPKAVDLFMDHMENLQQAFNVSQLPIAVYIQRPILLEEEKLPVKKTATSKSTREDKQEDSQNSGQ